MSALVPLVLLLLLSGTSGRASLSKDLPEGPLTAALGQPGRPRKRLLQDAASADSASAPPFQASRA